MDNIQLVIKTGEHPCLHNVAQVREQDGNILVLQYLASNKYGLHRVHKSKVQRVEDYGVSIVVNLDDNGQYIQTLRNTDKCRWGKDVGVGLYIKRQIVSPDTYPFIIK